MMPRATNSVYFAAVVVAAAAGAFYYAYPFQFRIVAGRFVGGRPTSRET